MVFRKKSLKKLKSPLYHLFWFVCFEVGFLCVTLTGPGTHSVDEADLEFAEIRLPLPPESWD